MVTSIHPLILGNNRLLWSVMIPVYNCNHYLLETINSVLCQDPGKEIMQIQIVDDCSSNNMAYSILEQNGLLNRVEYHRHETNTGLANNWNSCIELARGRLIHILHQDDMVLPGFYIENQTSFRSNPEIGAAFCRHHIIDGQGNILSTSMLEQENKGIFGNSAEKIASWQRIQTPAIVVRRTVYETLGGFNKSYKYVLDWEMWIRISNNYPLFYIPDVLATYRIHSNSETDRLKKNAETVRDMRRLFSMYRHYLNPEIRKTTEETARAKYANLGFQEAEKLLAKHDFMSSTAYMAQALLCYLKPSSIRKILQILYRFIKVRQ